MNKTLILVMIILAIVLSWLGFSNIQKISAQNDLIREWQKDTLRYNQQITEREQLVRNLKPGDDWIKPREENLPPTLADPYLSASQGVEVHLEGVRWMGDWFKPGQTNGIERMGGIAEVQINQILFDPDFEKAGMPDLNVEVTAPRFFRMQNFLDDWLGGFQLSGFLGKAFSEKKPVETYDLETVPGKKRKMSLWLMEFDAFLRIEPSPVHDNENIGGLEKHPVTGIKTSQIRRDHEDKNQRYGNVSIMLKFKPKDGTWYLADRDENGILVPNGSPKIGIGAVECIGIKAVSENENLNNIGVYLRRGSSLALYNSPEDIDKKFRATGINQEDALLPENVSQLNNNSLPNPDLFGKEKYAIIHLSNLGSWQEGSWLSSVSRYADQYHARFVIHAYVLGEWNVKPVSIAEPEPRPPFKLKKSGVLDFLLPDLHLGWLGKIISSGGWIVLGIIVLGFFFPPVTALLNKLLGWVIALIPDAGKK